VMSAKSLDFAIFQGLKDVISASSQWHMPCSLRPVSVARTGNKGAESWYG
jgi:hypothetical protein